MSLHAGIHPHASCQNRSAPDLKSWQLAVSSWQSYVKAFNFNLYSFSLTCPPIGGSLPQNLLSRTQPDYKGNRKIVLTGGAFLIPSNNLNH